MTEPEIARRCPACGVSIREVALFCPQCGEGLPEWGRDQAAPAVTSSKEATTPDDPPSAGEVAVEANDSSTNNPAAAAKAGNPGTAKASRGQAARGAMGAKIQRATTLARDVEGEVIHRAQRVRQMSGIVLDEAGYDPSLRFVLVAVVLFVVFLIILLLNKFIT